MENSGTIIAELVSRIAELGKMLEASRKETEELQKETAAQKEVIRHLQRLLFGKKSEKIVWDPSQLLPGTQGWFDQNDEKQDGEKQDGEKQDGEKQDGEKQDGEKQDGEKQDGEKQDGEKQDGEKEKNGRKKHPGQKNAGWNDFPANLAREEKILDIPEKEREGLKFIGYDTSERLVYRKACIVQVLKRARYVDPGAPGFGVLTAPLPPVPSCFSADTDRCRYDLTVIVHAVAEKLLDGIPFYRQSVRFARTGIVFGRSLMCRYFAKASAALEPLYRLLAEEIMACGILHADETSVRMLQPHEGKTKTCWIWVRKTGQGPPLTVFHFSLDRSSATAVELLGNYTGTIISDRYAAYGSLPAEAAGCWAHARRKFFEAQENHPGYASRALELVRRIYMQERNAKEAAGDGAAEAALFRERKRFRLQSAPLVKQYFGLCREIREKEPPSSLIAKAAAYSLNQEEALGRFLANPKLNIDNNPCENVIRPFCIGRKNWLFVGNSGGGTSMAVLASFAACCKDNGVDFEQWLCDVLPRLDTCPASEARTLLPHVWKTEGKDR